MLQRYNKKGKMKREKGKNISSYKQKATDALSSAVANSLFPSLKGEREST